MHPGLKKALSLLTAAAISMAVALPAAAAENNGGYWNETDAGWRYLIGEKPVTGRFHLVDGRWYNFDAAGIMQTGWYNLPNSDVWYYFDRSGAAVIEDWVGDNGKWYYIDQTGYMVTGWQKIKHTWYYFTESGALQTGWIKRDGEWYYMQPSGSYKTGWLKDESGRWYYMDVNGTMVTNEQRAIGGRLYSFDRNGYWWEKGKAKPADFEEEPESPAAEETETPDPETLPKAESIEDLLKIMEESVRTACDKRDPLTEPITGGFIQSTLMLDRSLLSEAYGLRNESGSELYLVLRPVEGRMNDLLIQLNVSRRTYVLSLENAQSKVWQNGDLLALMVLDEGCKETEAELEIAAAAFDEAAGRMQAKEETAEDL